MNDSTQPEFNESQFSAAPVADKQEHITEIHGLELKDDYFWMRLSDAQKEAETPDVQTTAVVDYLNAENDYKTEVLKPTEAFQESLFEEIVGRIKQDDQSVPLLDNGYYYYTRYEEGKEYPIHCRKKGSLDAEEEVMLNVNEMAEGYSYFAVGGRSVSTNNNLLAFSVDTVSRREYTLQFKDLATGEILDDRIPNISGGATWANDNRTVFYTKKDPVTLRSYRIYKHVLGTDATADELVYEEADETFSCGIGKTKSEAYLMIGSYSTVSSEWRFLDANTPEGEWQIIQPRERDLEYGCSHYGDHFYITTNRDAKNFKLVRTPVNATTYDNWEDVLPHRDDVLLEGIDIFKDYLVVSERSDGLNQIRVKRWDDAADYYIEFPDPAYS
ncbi:MAG: oligopeptidase B, partial [Flavobacteriales bacterium]